MQPFPLTQVWRSFLPALLALSLIACSDGKDSGPTPPASDLPPAPAVVAQASADSAASTAAATEASSDQTITEAFLSTMTPEDNIDSIAAWTAPEGNTLVFATAKSTDKLVIYDGDTGATVGALGERGSEPGQFLRPNGIAIIDDLLLVIERDNHRVQVFSLPERQSLGVFGAEQLIKPYGGWVTAVEGGYELYVTDDYETSGGEDTIVLEELGERVKRFHFSVTEGAVAARFLGAFGDTSSVGGLRVVESIWGDPANKVLLIAEEDETWANEFKIYDLDGNFSGRTFGADVLVAQAEGIALHACADGSGVWLTTEQDKGLTRFHLFERSSLKPIGTFKGEQVANTDGVWLHNVATRRFPDGAFYAVHDDQGLVAFDWREIANTFGFPARCP